MSYSEADSSLPTVAGVILLEWLLAASLGIFLIIALGQLYQIIAINNTLRQAQSTVATTLATVEQIISNRLHLSTALPCGNTPKQINLVTHGTSLYWLDVFHRAKQVHAFDSATASDIRRRGTATGDRADGSDVLVAFTAQYPTQVIQHDVATGTLTLADPTPSQPGQFVIVCDSQVTALFQVMQQSDDGRQVSYRGNDASPGNCATDFYLVEPCVANKDTLYEFTNHSFLSLFEPVVLFVGHSHYPNRRSLYREQLTLSHSRDGKIRASMNREEIIEGVEILRAHALADNVLDVGIVAAAPLSIQSPASSDIYLLGEKVTPWLPPRHFFRVTEFSLAL